MARYGHRNEFTIEDDKALARYLAVHNPAKAGRSGRAIYEQIAKHAAELGAWALAHPAQAWQDRYKHQEQRIDLLIKRYQLEHRIDASAAQRLFDAELRPMNADRKRTRPSEAELSQAGAAKRARVDHDGVGEGEVEVEVLDTSRDAWDRPPTVRNERKDELPSLLDVSLHSQAPAPSQGPPTPPHTNSVASPHDSSLPPSPHPHRSGDLEPPYAQPFPRPSPTPRPEESESDSPPPRRYPRQYGESPFRNALTASNGRSRISASGKRDAGLDERDMKRASSSRPWPPPRSRKGSDDRQYPTNTDMDALRLDSPVPHPRLPPPVIRRPQVNAVASSSRSKLPDAARLSPGAVARIMSNAHKRPVSPPPMRRAETPVVSPAREQVNTPALARVEVEPLAPAPQQDRRRIPPAAVAPRAAPSERVVDNTRNPSHEEARRPPTAVARSEEDEYDIPAPPAPRQVEKTRRAWNTDAPVRPPRLPRAPPTDTAEGHLSISSGEDQNDEHIAPRHGEKDRRTARASDVPAAARTKRRQTFASFGRGVRVDAGGSTARARAQPRKYLPSGSKPRRKSIAEPASQTYISSLRRSGALPATDLLDDLGLTDIPAHLRLTIELGLRQAIPGLVERYGFTEEVVMNVLEVVKGDLGEAEVKLGKMREGAGRAFRVSLGLDVGGEEEEGEEEGQMDGSEEEGDEDEDGEEAEVDVEMDQEEEEHAYGDEDVNEPAYEAAEDDEYDADPDAELDEPAAPPVHHADRMPASPSRRPKPRPSKLNYTPLSPSRMPYSPPPNTKARTYIRLTNSGRHDEAVERLMSSPTKQVHAARGDPSSPAREEGTPSPALPAPPQPISIRRLRPASSRSMAEEEDQDFGDEDPFRVPHFEDPPSQALPGLKSPQLPPSSQPQQSSQTLRSSRHQRSQVAAQHSQPVPQELEDVPQRSQLPPSSQPQPQLPSSSPGRLRIPNTPERTEIRAWMRDDEFEKLRAAEEVYDQGALVRCALEWVCEGAKEEVEEDE